MAACRTRAAETWESTILLRFRPRFPPQDRKSTRLNSSHSLHDALPISTAVINGGFGIFYGGLQNEGGGNLGVNYPFTLSASIPAPSCSAGNCPSIGLTLENGLSAQLANGLQNFVSSPSFHSTDPHIKEPYTEDFNLSLQQALSNSLVATLGYVGNVSRHIELYGAPNTAPVLLASGKSTTSDQPFPGLGGVGQISYSGVGTYNALQAKMEKRYSHGLSFLGTYTWAHALDDSSRSEERRVGK